ncbi:MAG TPA: zinc ribbon domain-containing protein [Anaerolinea thermolimosa]|uniref:Regulatory protein, FmdB family n=1 Tax=Anaerolinea thermolimosa TaxID=229919 RepID=A0A3D1JIW2_9CHLR|nr:zinc ribbon domain-containing protein [Anaerolinea thermolimosa]GAP08638.1 putative regulatory protein, FmdB family [Anaerolinea thermolimosa]HCE17708.1 zinc ribbon domain-containing protein [Anaerolinea thermolimosa]
MPLYEYHCQECGADFEKMVRFSEANTNPPCPHCNSLQTSKRLSTFASPASGAPGIPSSGGSCSTGGRFS